MSCDKETWICSQLQYTSLLSRMAAKAYVVSMTVSELKEELKQRGLSTKGSKKDLRDRLEQVSKSGIFVYRVRGWMQCANNIMVNRYKAD